MMSHAPGSGPRQKFVVASCGQILWTGFGYWEEPVTRRTILGRTCLVVYPDVVGISRHPEEKPFIFFPRGQFSIRGGSVGEDRAMEIEGYT
uniref:Uncharacterized protein n=1 Tax=Chromera velia CCMP2878 TaxID=1169474 RepID=A0A0G4HK68_9ALVE|eukprot:Cvel_7171.t1-p1 / transcript=Cvel_7171.t1 / gene=Cvel_7171 / organism=Chromera_velia_CCMP2878 / gene_product=hypothetical protein / transcript_product=hypothetical protein / location=Cvel_scaffold369:27613-29054(+) / protein_length=90 / sequence_SO=supercontig / SO=protein_coding / is_pseudo=false